MFALPASCCWLKMRGMKAYGAVRGVPPPTPNCGSRMEESGQLHIPAALSLEGEQQFLLNERGWVVTSTGLDILELAKTSCTSQTQPQFYSHQVQSLGTYYHVLTSALLHKLLFQDRRLLFPSYVTSKCDPLFVPRFLSHFFQSGCPMRVSFAFLPPRVLCALSVYPGLGR